MLPHLFIQKHKKEILDSKKEEKEKEELEKKSKQDEENQTVIEYMNQWKVKYNQILQYNKELKRKNSITKNY